AVAVRVEQQVGRLRDEGAAVTETEAAGDVEAADEVLRGLVEAVAVLVLEDRDLVGALRPLGRWLREAVVDGAQVLVDLGRLEAGGVGVLEILDDPDAPAIVEADREGLADRRFAGDESDLEAVGDGHALYGI